MTTDSPSLAKRPCKTCGSELPQSLLACPSCGALVHAERLKLLAAEAGQAERERRTTDALAGWRQVLALLPPNVRQHRSVTQKVKALSDALSAAPGASADAQPDKAKPKRKWGWLAALGALLAKFKWGLFFVLGKGKLLLTGLFQLKTLFSMLLMAGLYTSIWGWKFAVGLVLSIYIHEMGHVAWLRRYGIPASAPMFVPFVGAFVRLHQYPASRAEDARIGLAGPLWGAGASVAAIALGAALQIPVLLAIGSFSAWINLFNMIPVWQLDGGRGFNALSQKQRIAASALLWFGVLVTRDVMVLLVALGASFRALSSVSKADAPEEGDTPVLALYLALVAVFLLLIAVAKSRGVQV